LGGEGEGFHIFIFHETPDIAASVFGVQDIFNFVPITAADPEEHGESDDGDTSDTAHDTAHDGAND